MRFLVDECTGPTVARWLQELGHEVFSVYNMARGMTDEEVIQKANSENWKLITNDLDFGEKVYREQHPHKGIIVLRLADERSSNKIVCLQSLLDKYMDNLPDHFVVVTEKQVRFARS